MAFLDCEDVPLQILCCRKQFITRLTFEIFAAFMNPFILRKRFATYLTFVIFGNLMNWVDVVFQIMCIGKWFATRITFVILVTFMNCMDVSFQIHCLQKFCAWENTLPQDSHMYPLWSSWIVLMCIFKSPVWENNFS